MAACGGGGGGGEGGGEESITLSYAFFAPIASFPGVQMEEWAERMDECTDGQVEVEFFPGGSLLGSGDIYDGVSEGVVDIGMDSPAYDVGRFPLSSAVSLPVGFTNAEVASKTFLDLLTEYEPAEFDGYEIVTAFTTEPAYLQTQQPITSRSDLSGRELRAAGAGVPALQALGASPVGMPMPNVAESLQTGVITGYMSSREVLQDFGLAEQVSYVTDYPFGISNSFVAVMDEGRFAELPEDVQQCIQDLRPEMAEFASQYHDQDNVQPALEWAASEHGVETVELEPGEQEAFDETLSQLVDTWVDEVGGDFDPQEVLDRVEELRDQYSAEN
ncbi:TRAP transporter substrate-binding protein [Blastococcus goldschmidtiae]|uniref:TRAP transporter substrate-binding protein n=1 Tax=Blastococcus goldschmidtiae TaxID=3075546 RepID=A0ABU2K853_9ACTN|nr:TRAP transporter substrate-binding protein [Blastococcus sp. DSM 46792]MDT0276366.1 TRAP transporter substrate-binding protein [Blastococcus sp. DSM 46792]